MNAISKTRLRKYEKLSVALTLFVLIFLTLGLATVTERGFPNTATRETRGIARSGISDQWRRPLPASGSLESQTSALKRYGQLPLSFEANRGQTDARVKFLARGQGFALFLTGNEAVLDLRKPIQKANGKRQSANLALRSPFDAAASPGLLGQAPSGAGGIAQPPNTVLRMKLVGASPNVRVMGSDELPGKSNYLIGNDPKKWRTKVPNYARVEYGEVYSGVNLVYYGNQGQLEYDFVVAPGADPSQITLELGTGQSKIDVNGDLLVQTETGEVRFHKPVVYQMQATLDSRSSNVEQQSASAGAKDRTLRTKNLLD